jgi:FlaA1/EpsC-like NDP-sugar epimerase
MPMENEKQMTYQGKRILVTGGSGSIGSEIVRQLLKMSPKEVRIMNRSETPQVELKNELKGQDCMNFIIGDILDKVRLSEAMEDIDIIFHAAALKHVDISSSTPSRQSRHTYSEPRTS